MVKFLAPKRSAKEKYNLESTISEKFDAILQRRETASGMKDFFNIYYLSKVFDFYGRTLKEAVLLTARHRGRILEWDAFTRIRDFSNNSFMKKDAVDAV